ncbi:Transposon-like protein [Enhygromyxa salina]|uniref:Transposon-like protein n=1 Tax=Enhygromyxa salina TaxID=215803 RepID=A0A0C2DA91_9BACT|nr:hypothetical protein [Enhygromyxa salina]KIG16812.1 Transposon-like protein [Enhygromyxa salina]
MADVAAHLGDEVFPAVPVRQWVCSLPRWLRYAMGYDRKLCADVLDAFIVSSRCVASSPSEAATWPVLGRGRAVRCDHLHPALQRADSSLRLSVHIHFLVLYGVYVRDDEGELRFHSLGAPTSRQLTEVAKWTPERLGRVLERHGRSFDELACEDAPELLAQEQPALASCYRASVADRKRLGDAPGQQTRKLVHPVRRLAKPNEALAEVGGVNVHAGAAVPNEALAEVGSVNVHAGAAVPGRAEVTMTTRAPPGDDVDADGGALAGSFVCKTEPTPQAAHALDHGRAIARGMVVTGCG